ncbi:MAG: histidinol dehydrogenase, partial [Jatrophihabitantaceae bacterium]
MLRRLDLTSAPRAELRRVLPRAAVDVRAAVAAVTPVVEDVAARGYAAVREATLRFDGVDVPGPLVPAAALHGSLELLDPAVRDALAESIRRARIVHEAQRRGITEVEVVPGGTVTERWVPV